MRASLQTGEDVLVQGSGGVSVFAVQFAKAFGSRIIALSRNKKKAEHLMQLGAADVIDSNEHVNWEEQNSAMPISGPSVRVTGLPR